MMQDDLCLSATDVEQELALPTIDVERAQHLLRVAARTGLMTAEPQVSRFLTSSHSELRQAALRVLVFWWGLGERYLDACRDMLLNDPDADVRTTAASCLGAIRDSSKDQKDLRLLASIVRDRQTDSYLREAAYEALLSIIGIPPDQRPSAAQDLDFERDIDWDLVDRYGHGNE
jgi:hypothetical protein